MIFVLMLCVLNDHFVSGIILAQVLCICCYLINLVNFGTLHERVTLLLFACARTGSGGRIAIYAAGNTFQGQISAYGGSGPSTNANAAAGTIYLETGAGSQLYRKLIVNNNNLATNEAQRTYLSTTTGVSSVQYSFDEVNIVGSGRLAMRMVNASNLSILTFLNIQKLTGDGTGNIHAMPYTQLNLFDSSTNQSVFSSSASVSWNSAANLITQSVDTESVTNSMFLNTSSVFIYALGRAVFPGNLVVSDVTVRCDGDLFGTSSLTARGAAVIDLRSSGRSTSGYSNNYYEFYDVAMHGSSTLLLTHDRTVTTSFSFVARASILLRDSSGIKTTGLVQLISPVVNVSTSTSSISGVGGGFLASNSPANTACPQVSGNQGTRYFTL